jgi:hypothetical protein
LSHDFYNFLLFLIDFPSYQKNEKENNEHGWAQFSSNQPMDGRNVLASAPARVTLCKGP